MSKTDFSNQAVAEPSIPSASGLDYEGLAPTYARTMITEWVASFILLALVPVVLYFFRPELREVLVKWWIWTPYSVLLLSVFVWAPMVAKSRGFSLREHDIHYKSGLIWRKAVSLPFNRIQHVELESGPLERLFKLSTLKFFTAGGGSADMRIPALTFASASKLRAFVLEKAGRPDEPPAHNSDVPPSDAPSAMTGDAPNDTPSDAADTPSVTHDNG